MGIAFASHWCSGDFCLGGQPEFHHWFWVAVWEWALSKLHPPLVTVATITQQALHMVCRKIKTKTLDVPPLRYHDHSSISHIEQFHTPPLHPFE